MIGQIKAIIKMFWRFYKSVLVTTLSFLQNIIYYQTKLYKHIANYFYFLFGR